MITGKTTKIIPFKLFILIFLSISLSFGSSLFADEKILEINVDNKQITLSQSIRLDLVFTGVENMSMPELDKIDGFETTFLRTSDAISRKESQIARSTRHTFILRPEIPGKFKIGPFKIPYQGDYYTANAVEVEVLGATAGLPAEDTLELEKEVKAKENVFLLIAIDKNEVYVNEPFTFLVGLYFRDTRLTDIKYPLIAHEGFSIDEFGTPKAARKTIKGYDYRVITFNNKAFALKPGDLKFGPATLAADIQVAKAISPSALTQESGFAKRQVEFESSAKSIKVNPIPIAGMPDSFNGALGNFDLKVDIEPTGYIEIGDALTIRTEIAGSGNLSMVTPPSVGENSNYTLYEPSLEKEGRSYRIFEQILIPNSSSLKEIPKIEFSYFDPSEKRYFTLKKGPFPIKVFETKKSKTQKIVEKSIEKEDVTIKEEPIGKGIIYIKESPGVLRRKNSRIYNERGFMLINIMPIFLFLSILISYKRYEKLTTDIEYARNKRAYKTAKKNLKIAQDMLKDSDSEAFYKQILQSVQEYLGDKFNLSSAGVTADIAKELLKPKGFEPSIRESVKDFFSSCYSARFTKQEKTKSDMMQLFQQAKEIVEYFKALRR